MFPSRPGSACSKRAASALPWDARASDADRGCHAPARRLALSGCSLRTPGESLNQPTEDTMRELPVRTHRHLLYTALIAGLVAALPAVAANKTLVYCSEGSPEGFQPQFFSTGTTFDAVSVPMFNRLVEFETGTTNIIPALAESWTVSPDSKVVTFKLRHGVKFHSNANFKPTRDFNADDVIFSWNRMADDNHPFHKMTAGQTFAYFDDMGMKNIVDKVEAVDKYTVRFTLKRPEAPFLADMAMDFASINSAEYFDTMMKKGTPNAADIYPIGTGPFEFVSYQKDATIRYKAFDQYWKGRPKIDNLIRQALNMATNKDAILKAVYQGQGQVAKNPIPPILWSYNNAVQDYPYDVAKAKQLLAQAGYPNGFEVDLWYLPVTRPYNPDGKRMAEMIQADWDKIGVKAKLVTYEWAEYRKRSKTGEQAVMMFGWSGDNGDPDNFFVPLLGCEAVKGGGNVARWCNKPFEDLIIKAAQTPKQADRASLYEQAQVIVKEEAPWITLAHSVRFDPLRKEVQGYKMDATAHHYFTNADLAKQP